MGWPRAIMHLDMDAFFVNVYLLTHPEDAGRPLVVGGRPEQRGVVAAASYEARAFGIGSALPTRTALRLCPELKIVGHDWSLISSSSRVVMAILGEFGPLEPMSVDEAYVDLSEQEDPVRMASSIRQRVIHETGLPASVGLATTKLVAKVASDAGKPSGCLVVHPGDEAVFLADRPTSALHGVGPKTALRLEELGVLTCGQLATAPADLLVGAFGRYGEQLRAMASGVDPRPVVADAWRRKSLSSETTFQSDISDRTTLETAIAELASGVARGLERSGLAGRTVVVKFRAWDFTTFTRQRTLPSPTDDEAAIVGAALDIFRAHWPRGCRMRLLGVGASNLVEAPGRQLRLDL